MKTLNYSLCSLFIVLVLSGCSGAPKKTSQNNDNAPSEISPSLNSSGELNDSNHSGKTPSADSNENSEKDELFDDMEEELSQSTQNNIDPWEGMNRKTHAFNDFFDRNLLRPTAKAYDKVIPKPIDRGIDNVFSNIGEVNTILNDLLQFKLAQSASDTGRLLINSTLGIAGLIDVATPMGLKKHKEDFGQTLGTWGIKQGPYLVIPFLGPSTVRDGVGRIPDTYVTGQILEALTLDTFEERLSYAALYGINLRQSLLSYDSLLENSGADPYFFIRDAYLQNRANALKIDKEKEPPEDLVGEDDDFIFEE